MASTCSDITMYEVGPSELTLVWSNAIEDMNGLAGTSAFDFLGLGRGNPLYATDTHIHILGALGNAKHSVPRSALTLIDYPVAADVDNDASAELIYVSNYLNDRNPGPTVTVLSAPKSNWVRARRIWNQYAYHVTNVREDATIPQDIKRSWRNLNTFRANAQIRFDGRDCAPPQ